MPAAPACSPTATPATWCSASRWCCPPARSGTASGRCARTTPATTSSDLFIGAEGTLGIITGRGAASCSRSRRGVSVAFVGGRGPDGGPAPASTSRAAMPAAALTAFELMPRIALRNRCFATSPGTRDPLAGPHAWYVLMEYSSGALAGGRRRRRSRRSSPTASRRGWSRTARAPSRSNRRPPSGACATRCRRCRSSRAARSSTTSPCRWRPCRNSSSGPRRPSTALMPGARPFPFGHIGDGNIHLNISQPVGMDKRAFLARWDEVNEAVHGIVARARRHDLGRTRHRPAEARSPANGQEPGGDRPDAAAQGGASIPTAS